jgi:hypothetical protein
MSSWDEPGRDFAALSHADRLDLLAMVQRDQARLDAARARLLAAIELNPDRSAPDAETDKRYDREEVACVLRVAAGTARGRMPDAADLVSRYPATLAALERGEISYWHALRLVEAGVHRSDPVMAAVEQRVLPRAPEQTVSEFKRSITRALARLDPLPAQEQQARSVALRRVVFMPREDGTSDLWAEGLPAAQAAAMESRVRELAGQWKGSDERTSDQRQADALIALVLGAGDPARAALRPTVNVVIAASTLLGLDGQPADLDGRPVPAALARALAGDPSGTWRRLLTDENNRLVDVSAGTYTPPVNMARLVRLQQPTCVFPGCGRKAINCELDHRRAWLDGGPTSPHNLQPLCPRHHHLKHEAGWRVSRAPDGSTVWTSPTGRIFRKPPDDHLPRDTTLDPTDEGQAAA